MEKMRAVDADCLIGARR